MRIIPSFVKDLQASSRSQLAGSRELMSWLGPVVAVSAKSCSRLLVSALNCTSRTLQSKNVSALKDSLRHSGSDLVEGVLTVGAVVIVMTPLGSPDRLQFIRKGRLPSQLKVSKKQPLHETSPSCLPVASGDGRDA